MTDETNIPRMMSAAERVFGIEELSEMIFGYIPLASSLDLLVLQRVSFSWKTTIQRMLAVWTSRKPIEARNYEDVIVKDADIPGNVIRCKFAGRSFYKYPRAQLGKLNTIVLDTIAYGPLVDRVADGDTFFMKDNVALALTRTAEPSSCNEMFLTQPPVTDAALNWYSKFRTCGCDPKVYDPDHGVLPTGRFRRGLYVDGGIRMKHLRAAIREVCSHACWKVYIGC